jgi:hypothetical protein
MVDFAAFFMLKMICSIISRRFFAQVGGGAIGAEDLGLDEQGPGDI